MRSLDRYRSKRDFEVSPEPIGGTASLLAPVYSMQKHAASRLHFDLRLEHDGVLLSFAVTRGPSSNPADRRLAVRTEDHPLAYLDFEGTIPSGSYGAGTVMLWDIGHWQPYHDVDDGLQKGHLHFALHGERLTGGWSLVRLKKKKGERGAENWLLIKDDDTAARAQLSLGDNAVGILSQRTMDDITADTAPRPSRSRRYARPRFIRPQLAANVKSLDEAPGTWAEPKLDGYRALAALGRGGTRIYTRNGHDWTDRFAPLVRLLDRLPAESALIDGEIVVGAGLEGFSQLQSAIKIGGPFRFVAFDLLAVDGRDVRRLPLRDRRDQLADLFSGLPALGPLRLCPMIEDGVMDAFARICASGGEGLILKRPDAAYRSGRSSAWAKLKCGRRDDFIIVGWEPSKTRGRPFASLLLAEYDENGTLTPRGKVGTGFDDTSMKQLVRRFEALARASAPLHYLGVSDPHWLEPHLRAEIRFAEMTPAGRLRHPVFIGLRDDFVSVPSAAPRSGRENIGGIGVSSPRREVLPGLSKITLAQFYRDHASRILTTAANRPLSVLRLPDGIDGEAFFQRHKAKGWPDAIRTAQAGYREVMVVTSAGGLVGLVQMGGVELHIGGAKLDRPHQPDRLVFDLDPDSGLPWTDLRRAALEIRDDLLALGMESWPLATGGKGIYVVVRLRRGATWDTVTLFARTFATFKAAAAPEKFTASISKRKREGRVFIDWLRNEPSASAIAPYSVRARRGGTIATPMDWDEVARARRLPGLTVKEAGRLPDLPDVKLSSIGNSTIDRLRWMARNAGIAHDET